MTGAELHRRMALLLEAQRGERLTQRPQVHGHDRVVAGPPAGAEAGDPGGVQVLDAQGAVARRPLHDRDEMDHPLQPRDDVGV